MNQSIFNLANGLKLVFYFNTNTLGSFIDYPRILDILESVRRNISPFTAPDFWQGLTIEIWDCNRPDIPEVLKDKYGHHIGNLIMINSRKDELEQYQYYSNVISHELGHHFNHYIGLGISTGKFWLWLYNFWQTFRALPQAEKIKEVELFAEDFRFFFGADGAKDFERGDYTQANKIRGLKGFMQVFKKASDYFNAIPFYAYPSKVIPVYSSEDFNFFALEITQAYRIINLPFKKEIIKS